MSSVAIPKDTALEKTFRQSYFDHRTVAGLFTEEECSRIQSLAETDDGDHTVYVDPASRVVRNSHLTWLGYRRELDWLFNRVYHRVYDLNDEYYHFDLDDEPEAKSFQLTRYGSGQFYGWHTDIGLDHLSRRKLSFVVQLSCPSDYVGGNLQFHGHEQPLEVIVRDQGSMTVFPSFRSHCVTKTVFGTRWSLVGWIEGQPFR